MKHDRKNDHFVVVYDASDNWVGAGNLSVRKVGDYYYASWDIGHTVGEARNEPDANTAIRKAIEKAGYIPMTFDEAKAQGE